MKQYKTLEGHSQSANLHQASAITYLNIFVMSLNIMLRYVASPDVPLSQNVKESTKKILDPDGDPNHRQKLIDSSLAHLEPILKIS